MLIGYLVTGGGAVTSPDFPWGHEGNCLTMHAVMSHSFEMLNATEQFRKSGRFKHYRYYWAWELF